MPISSLNDRHRLVVLSAGALGLAGLVFALDLQLPLGVPGGLLYVALVGLGWFFPTARPIVGLGLLSSLLILAGWFFSPDVSPQGEGTWVHSVNRLLSMVAVWSVAWVLVIAKRSETAMRERVAELENDQVVLEHQGANLIHLADDLKDAREQAEAASRAKSQFLAAVSHELRTPLNAILGFAEIIKGEMIGPVGSERYLSYAQDIYQSGHHLLSLINDILDISKVEAGNMELAEEHIDLADQIHAVVRLVKQRAQENQVDLVLEIRDGLPILLADERKLKQVLMNLLSNSIKFTEAGGTVTLKAWHSIDSGFVFQIIDDGIGMAPQDIPKALSQFGQIDSDLNRKYDGTGLGLPLSKSLVEMHGGSLDLQSQLGIGTTATVRLPAARTVALETKQAAAG